MKKTLLIATILSYSSFSLPANAYKNSIYLDNPDTLNSIFAENFTLAQNNSLNNSEDLVGPVIQEDLCPVIQRIWWVQ